MAHIPLRCALLIALLILLPPLITRLPVLHWADAALVIYLWLLFHPLRPLPWLWRMGWLILAQALSPIVPWGGYVLAGILLTMVMRILQRSYVEHTHPAAFLLLLATGVIVWEGVIQLLLLFVNTIHGNAILIPPPSTLSLVVGREVLMVIVFFASVLGVRAQFMGQSVRDSLRRYYEYLQEPQFGTARG